MVLGPGAEGSYWVDLHAALERSPVLSRALTARYGPGWRSEARKQAGLEKGLKTPNKFRRGFKAQPEQVADLKALPPER